MPNGIESDGDIYAFEDSLRTLSASLTADESLARELYSALCNMQWRLCNGTTEPVSVSWRHAGAIVADLVGRGENYLDYYCGGKEGVVSDRVREALAALGWAPEPWPRLERESSAPQH